MGFARSRRASAIPTAPGALPFVGHSLLLWREPWEFLASLPSLGSGLVRIRLGPFDAIVVCEPALTRQLLRDDRTFDKGGPLFDVARRIVGDNVITTGHAGHRQQRRRIQPALHRARLPGYAAAIATEIDAVVDGWNESRTIDVVTEMLRLTTRSFLRTMFSESLTPAELRQALDDVTAIVDGLYSRLLTPSWLEWLPTRANIRYRNATSSLRRLVARVVGRRRVHGTDPDDLLSALLTAHDSTLDRDSVDVYDQLMAFFIAGVETTASALSWTLHLLSAHPSVLAAVEAEVDRVIPDGLARHEHIGRLTSMRRVLTESLRLYPPGWLFTRVVTADVRLGGYPLSRGTSVIYSPYLLHHLDGEYSDPWRFDPGRWETSAASPDAYLPFGTGPRRCAAEEFALTEAMLALGTIVRRWHLAPCSEQPVRPRVAMALRPNRFRLEVTARTVVPGSAEEVTA
ncbi:cytochrome P450 [Nocardia wallacei]|uniref:cytochrome P450 n=1 Tax=Nocardia wallacei TaxID=480035 RepID=UPI00245593D5|nr:cytochrome P450 [Nocardia wallacei]